MSTRFGEQPDFVARKQSEAEAETILRLSNVCQCSGIRGRGISKLIFENENSIRVLESYCKDEKDPCSVAYIMQMYANSLAMNAFFKNFYASFENKNIIISLFGNRCSDVVTLQCVNRLSLICIKSIDQSVLSFGFFESFIDDAELFFEDIFYAVEPCLMHYGIDITSTKKPVPWVGADLSNFLLSRRFMNQPGKQSKLASMFSWAKNWKGFGLVEKKPKDTSRTI